MFPLYNGAAGADLAFWGSLVLWFLPAVFLHGPQRRSVSEMEKAVFPLRKCTVFIFRKNRLRLPLWGSWGRAAPESCGRRLETGGAFLASFFRRRKKEGYKADAVCPKCRTLQTARGYQIKILNKSHPPHTSAFQEKNNHLPPKSPQTSKNFQNHTLPIKKSGPLALQKTEKTPKIRLRPFYWTLPVL